jgi:hypothetical protein
MMCKLYRAIIRNAHSYCIWAITFLKLVQQYGLHYYGKDNFDADDTDESDYDDDESEQQ